MVTLTHSFNISLEGDVLWASTDNEDNQDDFFPEGTRPQAAAVLGAPGGGADCEVAIRVSQNLRDDSESFSILFGIAADISSSDGKFRYGRGYFLRCCYGEKPRLFELRNCVLSHRRGNLHDELDELKNSSRDLSESLPEPLRGDIRLGQTLRLMFRSSPSPALCFGLDDSRPGLVQFRYPLPVQHFSPCIIIHEYWGQRVKVVQQGSLGLKRRLDERWQDGNYRKLWERRDFTDSTVRCGERTFNVHRAVLCAKSRAFASLFDCAGQEGATAMVDMTGEDPIAVAALLEHLYTAEMPKNADPGTLLPLADRYEVFDCVDDCAEALEGLALQRPAEALRALRPYADDKRLRTVWERVCNTVLTDRKLTMEVLRSP